MTPALPEGVALEAVLGGVFGLFGELESDMKSIRNN
jgi:hypothetical protein